MNPRKYLRRLTIFSASGLAGSVVNIAILWSLTQFGLWYIYSEIIGLIVGGLVHYNLNVASGNIRVASAGGLRGVQAECGCITKWNLICPNCENCIDHCDC